MQRFPTKRRDCVPRIRSLHPEQFTDDQFVSCSPLARLLALGVRNQSDDNGIFEWNPVKLKMRGPCRFG
jgi:hypothetical protein